jgi:hypothetical protein
MGPLRDHESTERKGPMLLVCGWGEGLDATLMVFECK